VVTVAVQTAAGSAAVVSAFPALSRIPVIGPRILLVISVIAIMAMCLGNLRGIREAGTLIRLNRQYRHEAAILADPGRRVLQPHPQNYSRRVVLGELTAVFYGRAHITGLEPGTQIRLRGMVSIGDDGRPAMINPAYELVRS
jgi:hypothetical protein